jgi:hypothetical protein
VAVCHSRDGLDAAARVRAALEIRSISCWTPPQPEGSISCASPDIDAINASWIVAFVLSMDAAADAPFVRAVSYAVAHCRWILGVRLDHSPVPRTLEYYVGDLRLVDATAAPLDTAIALLVQDAEEILAGLRGPMTGH